jgi:accessory gene regulator B
MLDEFVEVLVNNDIINNDEKIIYKYGIEQGSLIVINIITTVIIGMLFGMVIESIVFMFTYIPLRTYAGGYHAKNQLLCYFISIIMITVALLGIMILNLFVMVSIVLVFISFVMVLTLIAFGQYKIMSSIVMAQLIAAVMIGVGKIKQ